MALNQELPSKMYNGLVNPTMPYLKTGVMGRPRSQLIKMLMVCLWWYGLRVHVGDDLRLDIMNGLRPISRSCQSKQS